MNQHAISRSFGEPEGCIGREENADGQHLSDPQCSHLYGFWNNMFQEGFRKGRQHKCAHNLPHNVPETRHRSQVPMQPNTYFHNVQVLGQMLDSTSRAPTWAATGLNQVYMAWAHPTRGSTDESSAAPLSRRVAVGENGFAGQGPVGRPRLSKLGKSKDRMNEER
mmetsp:Transcript_72816/g.128294  ORF Transcript_72816/g.128294 Transcript_72816/m.128294 type:complete len:165 (-) Transcript_72816:61-555(-)